MARKKQKRQRTRIMSSDPNDKYYKKPGMSVQRKFLGAMSAHAHRNGLDETAAQLLEWYFSTDQEVLDRLDQIYPQLYQYLPRVISPDPTSPGDITLDDGEVVEWLQELFNRPRGEMNIDPGRPIDDEEVTRGEVAELEDKIRREQELADDIQREIEEYVKEMEERIKREQEPTDYSPPTRDPEDRTPPQIPFDDRNPPGIPVGDRNPPNIPVKQHNPPDYLIEKIPSRRKRVPANERAESGHSFRFGKGWSNDTDTIPRGGRSVITRFKGTKPRMEYGKVNYRNYKVVEQHTQKLKNSHKDQMGKIVILKRKLKDANERLRKIRERKRKSINADTLHFD